MAKYLLEIGCEEIPARFIDGLCRDLEQHTTSLLNDNRIEFGAIKTLATYRRLTLIIDDIATQQRDDVLEIKGLLNVLQLLMMDHYYLPRLALQRRRALMLQTSHLQRFKGKTIAS